LSCPENYPFKNDFRKLIGNEAKVRGRQIGARDWPVNPVFKLKIYNAMLIKLILNDGILLDFLNSKLPFRHYYRYGDKIVESKEGQWIIDFWEFIKNHVRGET